MPRQDPPPRVPRITPEQRTAAVEELIGMWSGPGRLDVNENHVLTTFAQHPELTRPFLTFNRYLMMEASLPVRLRQIAIMRVAWLRKERYVWSSHLRTSLRNGLTGEEFEPVKEGPAAAYWNSEERAVLRATDQLLECGDLDEDHWRALEAFLDRERIMELLFTVGAYMLLGMVTNPMGIQREPELVVLAEQYGAPEKPFP